MKKSHIQFKNNRTSVLCHKTQYISIHTSDVLLQAYWALNPIGKQPVPFITLVPLLYIWVYISLVTFLSHQVHSWSRPLQISFPWKSPLHILVLWSLGSRENIYCSVLTWFLHIPWLKCVVSLSIEFYHQVVETIPRVLAIDGT